jgi:hypothetical protein
LIVLKHTSRAAEESIDLDSIDSHPDRSRQPKCLKEMKLRDGVALKEFEEHGRLKTYLKGSGRVDSDSIDSHPDRSRQPTCLKETKLRGGVALGEFEEHKSSDRKAGCKLESNP